MSGIYKSILKFCDLILNIFFVYFNLNYYLFNERVIGATFTYSYLSYPVLCTKKGFESL